MLHFCVVSVSHDFCTFSIIDFRGVYSHGFSYFPTIFQFSTNFQNAHNFSYLRTNWPYLPLFTEGSSIQNRHPRLLSKKFQGSPYEISDYLPLEWRKSSIHNSVESIDRKFHEFAYFQGQVMNFNTLRTKNCHLLNTEVFSSQFNASRHINHIVTSLFTLRLLFSV